MNIVWLSKATVLAIHDEQLAEHGGLSGPANIGLLETALARPRNREAYGSATIAELAAAYAFALSSDHPFPDGNKRVSLVAAETFLSLNGHDLVASDSECVLTWIALAAGQFSDTQLAEWISERIKPIEGER